MSKFDVSGGQPHPLGATMGQSGCNFAVHCPNADGVEICLFNKDTKTNESINSFVL